MPRVSVEMGIEPQQLAKNQATALLDLYLQGRQADEEGDGPEEEEEEPADSEDLPGVDDSQRVLDEEEDAWPFDRAGVAPEPLPRLADLPLGARPAVEVRIAEDGRIHLQRGARDGDLLRLRVLLACAVARHLQVTKARVTEPGDWTGIPAIEGDGELVALVEEAAPDLSPALEDALGGVTDPDWDARTRDLLAGRLSSAGVALKGFGVRLPSGDVVTVDALCTRARGGAKKASFALRADGTALYLGEAGAPEKALKDIVLELARAVAARGETDIAGLNQCFRDRCKQPDPAWQQVDARAMDLLVVLPSRRLARLKGGQAAPPCLELIEGPTRATRAAALRLFGQDRVAGETWTQAHWEQLKKNEGKAR